MHGLQPKVNFCPKPRFSDGVEMPCLWKRLYIWPTVLNDRCQEAPAKTISYYEQNDPLLSSLGNLLDPKDFPWIGDVTRQG